MAPSSCAVLATQSKQQHVVAVPLPAQGHVNSLMRFCKLLASHGVKVTFVDIGPLHHRIEEVSRQQDKGDHEAACKPQLQLDYEGKTHATIGRVHLPLEGLHLSDDFRVSLEQFILQTQTNIAAHLEDLIHKLNREGPPVTCVISDVVMIRSTHNAAQKFHIPCVVLFPFCAGLLLLLNYVRQADIISTKTVLEALARSRGHRREIICEGLAGLPTIHVDELPNFEHVIDDNPFMWEILAESLSFKAHAMVLNSFEELEAPAFMTLSNSFNFPIYGMGPFVEPLHKKSSTSLWKEDDSCLMWLDQQPAFSVVYISFGSITLLTKLQVDEILEGLLSSQQRFLWVVRRDLVVGNVIDFATFLPYVISKSHSKAFVVDWAPQLQVLSHPSVGGFLTHCGWNSTMEAIAHGIPMLCWPYFADQLLVAKFVVEEWKVGLQFQSNKEGVGCLVEKGEVERVITALMVGNEGKVLRKNIEHLKEVGCQRLLPGGTSHNNIHTLIESLM